MTFVSYAQNYEDVMLFRALKDVKKGFYIDVGANDPIIDSVTNAFYERGWRGINIEPVRNWFDRLAADRPEDINLNIAVFNEAGFLPLYDIPETGLSTSNKEIAENHLINLGFQSQEIIVPTMTLDAILEKASYQEIHFLKIDVEGAEEQVLASINLKLTKPWIILVEATKPNSQEQDHNNWEFLLTTAGYVFVYFDGLNRFYISPDKNDLISAFTSPPNVFDNFIQFNHWNTQKLLSTKETEYKELEASLNTKEYERLQLEASLDTKEHERLQLETLLSSSQERVKHLENHNTKLQNELNYWLDEANRYQIELNSVYSSNSWRFAGPLRRIAYLLRTFFKWSK